MHRYEIIQSTSGASLGIYEGEDEDAAIRAMLADAGAPDAEADPGLEAIELDPESLHDEAD